MESTLLKLFTLSAERLAWPQVYKPDSVYNRPFIESTKYPPVTALYLAAYHELYEIATLLLDSGQDIDEIGGRLGTPLAVACYKKNLDVAGLLLDRGANTDTNVSHHRGALHLISNDDSIEFVRFLLDHGATADIEDSSKNTPLALATETGQCKIIKALLDHGANIERLGRDGFTPLMIAVYNLKFSAVNMLLDRGANIDHIREQGALASGLHICVNTGSRPASLYGDGFVQMATLLLDRGANVNLSNFEGLTPLAMAMHHQKPEMAILFLNRGADVFARDVKGRTVLKTARTKRRGMVIRGEQSSLVKVYDQIILEIEETEKAWQQEHGGFIDQEGTSDSQTETLDTEDDDLTDLEKVLIQSKRDRDAAGDAPGILEGVVQME